MNKQAKIFPVLIFTLILIGLVTSIDSINPSISINTPFLNASYLNYNTSIEINLMITGTNLNTCWYNDNNGANTTFTCGNNLSLNLSESLHTIYVFANDTLNNINNSEKISFTPDTTYPIVDITSITTTAGSQTISFDHTAIDTNINSCKYSIFNSTGKIDGLYENISVTCGASGTSATVTAYGMYNLTSYATDKAGNEISSQVNFSISEYPSESIIADFNLYNRTIMCEKVNEFLELRKDYTSDQRESLKNSLGLVFSFAISDSILDEYLENFEENCPEYVEPGEVDDVSLDKDDIPFYFWIFLAVIVATILVIIISLKRSDVNLVMHHNGG